jgi:PAS domain S-box-containing protein
MNASMIESVTPDSISQLTLQGIFMNTPGTILIVDDSPVMLTMLAESLAAAGFTVTTAASGNAALASVAALQPDLILLDILMPDTDGFAVCRHLNERAETRDIPVVLLTSADDVRSKVEGFRLGAVDYVNKPFQTAELVSRVQTHLGIGMLTQKLKEQSAELANANDKLLASEQRFKNIVATLPGMIYEYVRYADGSSRFLFVSRECEELLELSEQVLLTDMSQFWALIDPEDIEHLHLNDSAANREGMNSVTECRIVSPSGKMKWIQIVSRSQAAPDDVLTVWCGIILDITERKRMEETLNKNQKLLAETEKIGKVGGWEFNTVTGKQTWTEGVCAIHEVDFPSEPTVETGIRYYTPVSMPIIEEAVQRAIEFGEPFDVELDIISAKGNLRTVHAIGQADPENSRVHGFVQDITERKRVYDTLRLAHEKIRTFVDANIIGVLTATPSGVIIDANDYYLNLIGYTREECAQGLANWRAITPPEWLAADEAALAELRDCGVCRQYEKEYLRRDGSRVSVLLTDAMLSGPEEHIIAFALDITERKQFDSQLLASEERFRTVADFTYDWEYWIGPDLQFIYCSPACERISGYRAEEFVIDPTLLITITHPEDREMIRLHEKDLSSPNHEQVEFEFRIVTRGGEIRWLSHACRIVLGSNGEYQGRRASNRDITARKQLEDTRAFLAQASFSNGTNTFFEELARFLAKILDMDFICIDRLDGEGLNATTVAIWQDGKFEDNITYALKDTPCGELVGKMVCCFPERVCDSFPDDQVLRDLRAECYIGVTLWGHDGKPIGLIAVIGHTPLKHRQQAEAVLKMVAGRAASELERINYEAALLKSEAEFRRLSIRSQALLDTIPDSLILLDRDLKILWGNKPAAETLGLSPALLVNQPCYELWHNRTTFCDDCAAMKCFASGDTQNAIVTRADGSVWDVRSVPLCDETGEVKSVIEVNRDITEYRQLEEQLRQSQKMESIGTLAGGIAHDFNNILTTISGYGQITLEGMPPDDPQRYNIDCILEGSERAVRLIKDLLMFSRRHDSEKRSINLNEVISKLERFLKKVIGEDIHFQTRISDAALPVLMDEHQLEQVLMNLATNASQAMPHGGELSVTTEIFHMNSDFIESHGYGQPGRYALLTVKDTGLGMDETTQQRVFEPFFSTKEVGKGTGLGLAVVYGIITQHNGYIDIDSTPGIGTMFSIYLPLADACREEEEQRALEVAVTGGKETILVAEDDEMVRNLTRRVLTEAGYTVITATDGSDAQVKFAEHRAAIDLLIFDLIMPKINGKDAFDEIHKNRPGIKVIFSSGYAPETIKHKISLGEDVYLIAKPVSPRVLLRKVRAVLDGKGAE